MVGAPIGALHGAVGPGGMGQPPPPPPPPPPAHHGMVGPGGVGGPPHGPPFRPAPPPNPPGMGGGSSHPMPPNMLPHGRSDMHGGPPMGAMGGRHPPAAPPPPPPPGPPPPRPPQHEPKPILNKPPTSRQLNSVISFLSKLPIVARYAGADLVAQIDNLRTGKQVKAMDKPPKPWDSEAVRSQFSKEDIQVCCAM